MQLAARGHIQCSDTVREKIKPDVWNILEDADVDAGREKIRRLGRGDGGSNPSRDPFYLISFFTCRHSLVLIVTCTWIFGSQRSPERGIALQLNENVLLC